MIVKWLLRYSSLQYTALPELKFLVPLTLDSYEGDGGEQKFSMVHGTRLG
jgi:hypothetical protein